MENLGKRPNTNQECCLLKIIRRKPYGELEVVPISFREEVYGNDKVSIDLYPTGSAGIFDVFVEYRNQRK